jgi:Ca-activated chloride channel family protein
MDHPKDIRFRYNRGCAAFQSGNYQDASAAFSSVIKRSRDSSVRFKAAYNLGNTAYKQGDFATSAARFKEALAANPGDEDTRYNLELALRAIEKMKQKQADAPNAEPETGNKKMEGDKEPSPENNEQAQGKEKQQEQQNRADIPKGDKQQHTDDSKPEDTKGPGDNQNDKLNRDEKPESDASEDLSGELGASQSFPEREKKNGEHKAENSTVDKKRAEALLDNVQENPKKVLRFMMSKENRQGPASGRDW